MQNITLKRFSSHLLFWVAFIFAYPLFYNLIAVNNLDLYLKQVKNIAIGSIYLILAAYFITYYLVPNLLINRKRYFLLGFSYLATFFIITLIDIVFTRYFVIPKEYPEYVNTYFSYAFKFKNFLRTFLILHSQVFIFIAVRFFIQFIKNYFEKEKLKAKMSETELNMLKGQIHPHFLFNTLNNIYTLSLDCNSEKLSESIAKMSDILRFTLYDCNTSLIPLDKELKIITDYIGLEKLRYSDIKIDLSIPKNIQGVYIIPLILFTFIENAFKHGTSKTIGNKWITAGLFLENNILHFNVRNSKNLNKKNPETFQNYTQGIGIKNASKRLELFYGKKNYTLDINDNDVFFEINLRVNIKYDI